MGPLTALVYERGPVRLAALKEGSDGGARVKKEDVLFIGSGSSEGGVKGKPVEGGVAFLELEVGVGYTVVLGKAIH